ncbi:hypothetical protein ACLKA7_013807 [Drosophila subpalustris]
MNSVQEIISSPSDYVDVEVGSRDLEKGSIFAPLQPFDVIPIPDGDYLTESIANCNKPLCDDADLECILNMVSGTLCEALMIIQSDPRELFCYKYPENPSYVTNERSENLFGVPYGKSEYSMASEQVRNWMTIGEFDYSNMVSLIRDYISQWHLSPDTKCVVLTNTTRHDVPLKGSIYFIDAHFSRPSPRCPNPLAVAKVRFVITVSSVMQSYYPVMVTYRFEGYRTLYYTLGSRAIISNLFQRFYIDTILHTKLSFYAEICESRHGTIAQPKDIAKDKK